MESLQLLAYATAFYQTLYSTSVETQEIQQMRVHCQQSLPQKVMDEQIERLTMPFTVEELDDVIAHASLGKAPRLDLIPS